MRLSLEGAGEARAVLIAGPTASGKSRAALHLAEQAAALGRDPLIVNADSMQVYDALPILTARPGAAELGAAPHRLYGHVAADQRYSVGRWLADVTDVLATAERTGALPIIVGGTGLYLQALTEGLAELPPIPADLRAMLAGRLAAQGSAGLHARLAALDPAGAAAIRPSDPQRILRALEVLEASGRTLAEWQAHPAKPLLAPAGTLRYVLEPERPQLHRQIELRLEGMVRDGALDEVRALLDRDLAPELPAMKAIGVSPFAAALRGAITLEEAKREASGQTRRYAKRQGTWFRNQMPDWTRIPV